MAVVLDQYETVAETVVERTAELLSTRVAVSDARGVVIASSERETIGLLPEALDYAAARGSLRVPISLFQQSGEVIVAEPESGEAISPRLARVLVELVVSQAVATVRLPNQSALKNKFIHDLLRGPAASEAEILRESEILGMDLRSPRAVILIDASNYILADGAGAQDIVGEARIRRRAQVVIASAVSFFNLPNDTICAYIGSGEVAILKASSTHDLVAWADCGIKLEPTYSSWANLTALKRAGVALLTRLRHDTRGDITVGIGRYHPGIHGLAKSYEDARAALLLGRRFRGQNQVHCLDGLGIAAFVGVADEGTKIDLAVHLLSPLDNEPELLDTLDAFFGENCCPSDAAARLAIHRNTLSYRLDKITSLTGLDPRRFDDAVQIRLALLLRPLQNQPG